MESLNTMINLSDEISASEQFKSFTDLISQVMEIPEANLNDQAVEVMEGMISAVFTKSVNEEAIVQIVENFKEQGTSKADAQSAINMIKSAFNSYVEDLKPSPAKNRLLQVILNNFYAIFDEAAARYGVYDFILPIQLEEGAQLPTYAHPSDAAADLYAADTVTLSAHSTSNMVRTGVHIGLPAGWMAMIFPRSSIGAKTGLRLSNSAGIIDSGYRGPLGVLYDNISDSDYTINAGDRIAQLLVMPSYRFRAEVVDTLDDTDRGQGGFGSSGK